MLTTAAPTPSFAAAVEEINWFGPVSAIVGVIVIGLLVWQLWQAQRQYAVELAEQSRQVAEEQAKSSDAQQEKKAMARESQAKSEMLATLSREIRAHLNGIIGSADLMLDNSLKPQQREHLATLRASAESLHQSLNDVLDYSSIETGQIKITQAPFDLRQPLVKIVENLSPLALLKGLELVLIVAPDVPLQVVGDAVRLRQILLNLMSNAVKFTASGRVVLRVELPQGSAGTSKEGMTWLHFSVSDTGTGIPEELQATIFDRPAKSDAPSPRKFGGSGLELAISKRLVELMGGRIGARSLPEGGSEFWVVLAFSIDQGQVPAVPARPDGMHVVVLDDLAAARVAVSAMLTRMRVDHDATDTVANAAELLRDALEVDVVERVLLLDESVAKDSGAELARLLAEDPTLQSTRIVLLSLDPDKVATDQVFPVAAIVRKPLARPEALWEALSAKPDAGRRKTSGTPTPFAKVGEPKPIVDLVPRVLVVDDDAISRSVSSQLLERLGCVVEMAVSGAAAIDLVGRTKFDLVFMDCQMPEMDGYETTVKIRAAAGSKAPPIVALTANISAPEREKCFAVGMCDFISKPVHKADLAVALKRWVTPTAATAT